MITTTAHAGELCAPGGTHRGATLDLDVKNAEIHDVLRLLADTAKQNLVVSDTVSGKVTLRLKRVPWDAALCTVARVHHLTVTLDDGILMVMPQAAGSRARLPTDPSAR